MENLMSVVENQYARKPTAEFNSGDSVKVYYKIIEGDSERTQIFEGVVLRIRGAGNGKTITVRKVSFGIGIERIFLFNSPRLEKIELMKRGKVRRSRLYYLRGLSGKSAKIEERSDKDNMAKAAAPAPKAEKAAVPAGQPAPSEN